MDGANNGSSAAAAGAVVASTPVPVSARALDAASTTPPEAAIAAAHLFRDGSRFWVQRVLVPIVVTVGVIGNLVTVVVLTRRRMRSSTNMYLTALAVSDLLYLIFMFSLSLEHYPGFSGPDFRTYWEYNPFGRWFADATSSSSVWLTVSFTVERYIAVCHPLRGKVLCTERRARAVIGCVFAACVLATATTPFEWQVTQKENGWGITYSKLGNDETYQTVFYWFTSIMFIFLPLVLLGFFNSFLVRAVHQSQKQRFRMTQVDQHESSSSAQTQENRITIVLISVVVLFMVCQLPTAFILLYSAVRTQRGPREDGILRGLGNIFNFLVAIHSSCNFLLYCALSDKYRRTFMVTFFPRCAPLPPPGSAAASLAFSTANRLSVRAGPMGGGGSSVGGPARGFSLRVHPAGGGGGGTASANGLPQAPPFKRHASAYIPRPRPAAAAALSPTSALGPAPGAAATTSRTGGTQQCPTLAEVP